MSAHDSWFKSRWERMRSIPGLGRDVGALAGLVVLGIVSTVLIQSGLATGLPWEQRDLIRAEFEEVPGLFPASSHHVTISGVRVGNVADWEVSDRGTAIVTLELETGHTIYDNARAVLRPKNPLNEMAIELNPGTPEGQPLERGDIIPLAQTHRPIQVDEILEGLDGRSQDALTALLVESDTALARAPAHLPGGLRAADDLLEEMQPVAEQLAMRRDNISELVTALSELSGAVGDNDERLTQLLEGSQTVLTTLSDNDGQLRESLDQLPGLTRNLDAAMSSSQRLASQLDPTLTSLDGISQRLPFTLQRLGDTVDEIDRVVEVAAPVLEIGRPVVADLRPLVDGLDDGLAELRPVTRGLDTDTEIITSYLDPIAAFVYNTSSVFGAGDSAETGIIRGHATVPLDGHLFPGGRGGFTPTPEESGVNPGDNNTLEGDR